MTKYVFSAITIILLSVFLTLNAEQSITASAKADKARITIGDRVNYLVTLASPRDFKFSEPQKQERLGPWDIKGLKTYQEEKDALNTYLNYTLTTYTTGQVLIPEILFRFSAPDNSELTVKTSSLTITVESVLGLVKGEAGLRDLKPPLALKIPLAAILFWLAIITATLYGAWLWYQNYRKKLHPELFAPQVPVVPPLETATLELERLKNSGLLKEGRVKEFYIALSDIIRKYLGAIYSFEAMDKTTAEIYQSLKHKIANKKALIAVKEFFEECDLVKFAKYRPDEKTAWQDFNKADTIVHSS